jgi:hypothetical protein
MSGWSIETPPGPSEKAKLPTLRDLSHRLSRAEIMDVRSVEIPGAVVVLPWGMALTRRMRATIEHSYEARGYECHEFPHVAPVSVYTPALERFGPLQQLLYVADRESLGQGRSRGVLAPTGESVIYHHWARTVRTSQDLPIRLYRNAVYFRPMRSGRGRSGGGMLRPLEAPDVHEFHCAVAEENQVTEELTTAIAMVDEVLQAWRTPVLWSMRPPWGNNGELYRAAYGADALLPTGDTVQAGVVYDQGDVFSRAFDIRLRDSEPHRHTLHVTGCVTRRLLLTHLFGSDLPDGFALHPDVAPVQTQVRGPAEHLQPLGETLAGLGIRARLVPGEPRQLVGAFRQAVRRGVPAQVLIQGPRHPGDSARVVLSDVWGHEEVLQLDWPDGAQRVAELVRELLADVAARHDAHARRRWAGVRRVRADEVADVMGAGGVAVVALAPTPEAVAVVERDVPGEVLGLVPAAGTEICVVTGAPVRTYAALGRRV